MRLCKCGAIVANRCLVCYPMTHARTTKQRGYDHAWRKLSERVRQEQPLCPDCETEGRAIPSTEVHHIVPIKKAPKLRLVRSNLIAVCKRHHEERERAT